MGSKRAAASGESGRVRGRGAGLAARASKAEMRACTSLIVGWRASAHTGTGGGWHGAHWQRAAAGCLIRQVGRERGRRCAAIGGHSRGADTRDALPWPSLAASRVDAPIYASPKLLWLMRARPGRCLSLVPSIAIYPLRPLRPLRPNVCHRRRNSEPAHRCYSRL